MNTLERLKPFRYMALAVFALLLVAIFLAQDSQPRPAADATEPTPPPGPTPPTQQGEFRPPPRIAPAKHIYKVETTDPVVFLTIDDGQYRDPAMVDILKRNGIKATFFLTETYVRHDPDFFRKLRDDTGSAIENHTATHANLKGKPAVDQTAEIGPVSDHYAEWFGQRPTLFRAPYGNIDDNTLQVAGEAGCRYVVNWGSEVINGKISFSGPKEFRPGSIVLMHFRPTFEADVNAFVAQARQNGLTPALLTDYLN
ncbi:polysaccharide deacetylase family protein [Actinocrispum wychmicini]|uniref:Polysaccharide deacetylase n=1 Tax=Actinocrispum wychmicini TaxID=1213861 RepID=A0A4R2JS59_9PSEU|nr:polysaccharide deacetylase family protein [Actinocrispum wychmicini]TCO62414.1 polysaccharide deacetylase [Actinocrispum wychmicini]